MRSRAGARKRYPAPASRQRSARMPALVAREDVVDLLLGRPDRVLRGRLAGDHASHHVAHYRLNLLPVGGAGNAVRILQRGERDEESRILVGLGLDLTRVLP